MAEAKDVINALIENTKSGKLEWKSEKSTIGNWTTQCDGVEFFVSGRAGEVTITVPIPGFTDNYKSESLGSSSELLRILQENWPMALVHNPTREEVLQHALECLHEEKA